MAISLVSKMFGSGLQVDRGASRNTKNVYVPPVTQCEGQYFSGYPPRSPPFFGTWKDIENRGPLGMGVKKKSWQAVQRQGEARGGPTTRIKKPIQRNPHIRRHFVIKPLSNFDLMDWVKKLGIKHFRGVFSRDGLPRKIKKECGIINLDDLAGPGTHWVCYRNLDSVVEYFDPFGLIMPNEAAKYFHTANPSRKRTEYSIDEIQNHDTVLCGYWCLYYLLERQMGNSMLDVIQNPHFDDDNSDFIKAYFS